MKDDLVKLLGLIEELFFTVPKRDKNEMKKKVAEIDNVWEKIKKKILKIYA
ncbi:MAG: hypothetical protein UT34_C0002G0065 [candidate division WS6 bacterium GW2011_GWF2_39_15]|uniref:Uncharacterized protein n=1 Tax=candidate division WS6 bacterium GW2011_GWF2_39_15 TaxID=1619100 RepID=A0A0G0MQZ3_9BACT|nr:MAG: hypothetical protein UT34_C0002G0065 [candidate division WS6 bacterium GW2011_GWF2_39_15]